MIIMKIKNIKILCLVFVFCILINSPNFSIETENCNRIKSSEEADTNITMENVNDTLTFRINSSRDVTAFRLSFIVNHTNGSSFYDELGGMGDIFGVDILPLKLRFWTISKTSLLLYNEGGYLYNFLMKVYSINPIDGGTFFAGRIELDSNPPDEDGEGDDNSDPNEEGDLNLTWVWIILIVFILGFGVYGFFHPIRNDSQSLSEEGEFNIENINPQSADALERRRRKVRTNRNT